MGNKSNKIADESPAVNEAGSPASGGGKEAAPVTCDKIVLLGVGGVGKSTVFKQAKMLYCSGFSEEEIKESKFLIIQLMIRVMTQILSLGPKNNCLTQSDEYVDSYSKLLPSVDDINVDDEGALHETREMIKTLWAKPDIKAAHKKLKGDDRTAVLLNDGEWIGYFYENIDTIMTPEYVAPFDDIVKLRRETVGAQKVEFQYNGLNVQIVDVGGQFHERLTWEENFAGVRAVIYMASLADYDQIQNARGSSTNKLRLSFEVFKEVCGENPMFAGIPIVVLLNKTDLFEVKIPVVSFGAYMPDCESFEGDEANYKHDPTFCKETIKAEYEFYEREPMIRPYFTNATDTQLIEKVFEGVFKSLQQMSAKASGLG